MRIINRLFYVGFIALILLFGVTAATRAIMFAESATGWYPIVSQETLDRKAELSLVESDFALGCQEDKGLGRDLWFYEGDNCLVQKDEMYCEETIAAHYKGMDAASDTMHDAVARRKELSRELDFNGLVSFLVGTTRYTHATWLCTTPYATFDYEVNIKFTRTDQS